MQKWLRLLPTVAFTAFLIKTFAVQPTFPDSIILSILVAYIILDNFRVSSVFLKEFETQMLERDKKLITLEEKLRQLEGNMSAVKISAGFKSTPGVKI